MLVIKKLYEFEINTFDDILILFIKLKIDFLLTLLYLFVLRAHFKWSED